MEQSKRLKRCVAVIIGEAIVISLLAFWAANAALSHSELASTYPHLVRLNALLQVRHDFQHGELRRYEFADVPESAWSGSVDGDGIPIWHYPDPDGPYFSGLPFIYDWPTARAEEFVREYNRSMTALIDEAKTEPLQ